MGLSQKYKKSLDKKWAMKFKSIHPNEDTFDGVVISNKKSFISLIEVVDFEFDGIIILPKKNVERL